MKSYVPLVSVIMTTYNHEKYIAEAIESILQQTLTDFELIIINDGSRDRTEEIIRSFQDNRIIYIYQENQGPSAAANQGILKARGKYIALMSGDDVCYPQRLEKQYEYLKITGSKIVFAWVDFINDKAEFIEGEHFAKTYFNHHNRTRAEILNFFFLKGNYFCAVTAFIETEVLLSTGLFNLSLIQLQDFELWIKLVKNYDMLILDERLVKYRILGNGSNLSNPVNSIRSIFEGYQLYKTIFNEIPINIFKEAFSDKIINSNFKEGIEYELEKAFLYFCHSSSLIRSIGADKMYFYLQDNAILSVARKEYNFGLTELFKVTQEMDISNSKPLQQTRSELEVSQFQLQQTRSELEVSRSQLQQTRSELEVSRSQLQRTCSELEIYQNQTQQQRKELEQKLLKLQQNKQELVASQQRIRAMETSKFWNLKKVWFRLKEAIGIKKD